MNKYSFMFVMVITTHYLQRFHQTGQIMFLYFQIKLRRMKQLLNLVKQFIFTDLVMKIEQVMRTKLMNIRQVKAKKAYILVSCMVRIVNLQLTKRYTEFILEDLNSKLYHYWALGHIHERQQLSICL